MEISSSSCARVDQINEPANGFTTKVAHLVNYLDHVTHRLFE